MGRRRLVAAVGAVLAAGQVAGCGADTGPGLGQVDDSPTEVRGKPVDLAVGEGGVWVGNRAGQVFRVDPGTRRVVGSPIPVGSAVSDLAFGEGAVWAATQDGTVSRIDPRAAKVTHTVSLPGEPRALATVEGSVWVVLGGEDAVAHIDTRTSRAEGNPIPVGRDPHPVAAGPRGVWVGSSADRTVTRINPEGERITGRIRVPEGVRDLAVDRTGAVWVAHGDGRGSLGRIAPDTSAAREVAAHLFPEGAVNVLVDPAGDLWVLSGTDSTSSGSGTNSTTSYIRYVHRLDPARRRDFGKVPITDDAEELAVGEGSAWFLDPEYSTINRTGAVRRIDLTPRADLEAAKERELTQTTTTGRVAR